MSNNIVVSVDIPSWANKEFITKILRREEDDDATLTVTRCDLDGTTTVGDNYMSVLIRIAVEYNTKSSKSTKKLKLIVKSLPPGELMQKWIWEIGAFDHEIHMYEVIFPQFTKLVKEKIGDDELSHLAPKMFANDRPNTIVLEDLTPYGYKMANRRQGLDIDHSIQALRTLAKLHGTSIALHAQNPKTMDFFEEVFYIEKNRKMLADFMETAFDSLARTVGSWEGYERFEEKVKKISSTAVDKCIELMKTREGSLRVLNHGDFWTNNMLFRYDEGKVVDAKMIDFQMGRYASPAFDLIYFLYTSPTEHILENCWDQLIEEYHESLSETLKKLECNESLYVTLDQIKKELEDKAYFSVIMSCMFSIMVAEPEDAPDLASLTEKNLDTVGATTMNKAFSGKRFRNGLQRRLTKFEEIGFI